MFDYARKVAVDCFKCVRYHIKCLFVGMSKSGCRLKCSWGLCHRVNKRSVSVSENHSILYLWILSALVDNGKVAKIVFGVQGIPCFSHWHRSVYKNERTWNINISFRQILSSFRTEKAYLTNNTVYASKEIWISLPHTRRKWLSFVDSLVVL